MVDHIRYRSQPNLTPVKAEALPFNPLTVSSAITDEILRGTSTHPCGLHCPPSCFSNSHCRLHVGVPVNGHRTLLRSCRPSSSGTGAAMTAVATARMEAAMVTRRMVLGVQVPSCELLWCRLASLPPSMIVCPEQEGCLMHERL